MKSSGRPISSPGRMEKFPPPLMRFLRTNAASRSRGSRSRASPMFIKQRTTGSAPVAGADTKEPSSPKVTCMGQVRARRSKHGQRRTGRHGRWRCRWIPRIILCRVLKCGARVRFPSFRLSSCCFLGWPKWGSVFRFGSRGRSGKWGFGSGEEDFRDGREDVVGEDEDDGEMGRKVNCLGSSPSSPPKNALILTRCRSAPYTSTSLACRFWGSPFDPEKTEPRLSSEKTEPRLSTKKPEQASRRSADTGGERIETNSSDRNPPDGEPDVDCKTPNSDGTTSGSVEDEDDKGAKSGSDENRETPAGDTEEEAVRPLMLTRCKSEPARTAEKMLDPEATAEAGGGGFWRKTRVGVVDSSRSPCAL
ncbi:hypothetical protein MLD38_035679 [Melastoma candidum]|uniref:Uncharacterized protein n=1 Tax=Melastoma candidum TaxID=119954 RepID=A0ACB9LHV3_9MYRT|nr:hypothetical protein MLD38_035679 [Melastoma candidum]